MVVPILTQILGESRCSAPSYGGTEGDFCRSPKVEFAERTVSRLPQGVRRRAPMLLVNKYYSQLSSGLVNDLGQPVASLSFSFP